MACSCSQSDRQPEETSPPPTTVGISKVGTKTAPPVFSAADAADAAAAEKKPRQQQQKQQKQQQQQQDLSDLEGISSLLFDDSTLLLLLLLLLLKCALLHSAGCAPVAQQNWCRPLRGSHSKSAGVTMDNTVSS